MKKKNTGFHKIELVQKKKSKGVMVGANSELLIDGKPLKGVTEVVVVVRGGEIAEAHIKMIGQIRVKGRFKTLKKKKA